MRVHNDHIFSRPACNWFCLVDPFVHQVLVYSYCPWLFFVLIGLRNFHFCWLVPTWCYFGGTIVFIVYLFTCHLIQRQPIQFGLLCCTLPFLTSLLSWLRCQLFHSLRYHIVPYMLRYFRRWWYSKGSGWKVVFADWYSFCPSPITFLWGWVGGNRTRSFIATEGVKPCAWLSPVKIFYNTSLL